MDLERWIGKKRKDEGGKWLTPKFEPLDMEGKGKRRVVTLLSNLFTLTAV